MPSQSEKRDAEMAELHKTEGQPTRLQVLPKGADLIETINGVSRHLKAGEVFLHPAPKRVKQLLAIEPAIVQLAPKGSKTPDEQKREVELTEEAIRQVTQQERERAIRILKERQEKLDKLEKSLRAMTPEVLAEELKKRNLTIEGTLDDKILAAVDQEKSRLEAEASK